MITILAMEDEYTNDIFIMQIKCAHWEHYYEFSIYKQVFYAHHRPNLSEKLAWILFVDNILYCTPYACL
jgi:hypothetical protein